MTADQRTGPRHTSPRRAQGWSLLSRCGPLSLLGASFLFVAGGLSMTDLRAGLIAFAGMTLAVALMVGRARLPWWRLFPGLLAFSSVTWSSWLLASPREIEPALVAGLRVVFFVAPGLVLGSFVDPFTLGDHLGQRLRLPARPVLATVAALQHVDAFAEDWETLTRARRVRGLGPNGSPLSQFRSYATLTFALLVEAIRKGVA